MHTQRIPHIQSVLASSGNQLLRGSEGYKAGLDSFLIRYPDIRDLYSDNLNCETKRNETPPKHVQQHSLQNKRRSRYHYENLEGTETDIHNVHILLILRCRTIRPVYPSNSVQELDTNNVTVGFYTHSIALIADAFHYVCEHSKFGVATQM